MKKNKVYKVRVRIVERFDDTVLVEASSAKEAVRLLEKDFVETGYVYDKVTECATDRTVRYLRPTVVAPGDVPSQRGRSINLNVE